MVESGNDNTAIGDNGDSKGAYQIQRAYFKDAVEYDKSLRKYKYEDVKKDFVARLIIRAYLNRYCTEKRLGRKPTDEDRARCHNGGPNGYKKDCTNKYWAKVQAQMEAKK
jgi:hypothetical protein